MSFEEEPSGLEAVRRRPGMYVGDVYDGSGLHHIVWEVVANVIDLHLAGKASCLEVDLSDGWVEVRDDGPGFPTGVHPQEHRDVLEVIFTTLHTTPTFDGHSPHVHIASHLKGVGLGAVNAVCEELQVETRRRGRIRRQSYRRGRPVAPVEDVGPTDTTGATIRLLPDPEIFASVARTVLSDALVRAAKGDSDLLEMLKRRA